MYVHSKVTSLMQTKYYEHFKMKAVKVNLECSFNLTDQMWNS